jgi:ATP-dependent 26S proteasome regulatory subunit
MFDLFKVNDPKLALDAIDQLVMKPESNKDTIKAIVKTYTDSEGENLVGVDFIPGKGEGQIILLHGPPGTGKTLTAGRNSSIKTINLILMMSQNLLLNSQSGRF